MNICLQNEEKFSPSECVSSKNKKEKVCTFNGVEYLPQPTKSQWDKKSYRYINII